MMNQRDTIAAIATAPGEGGIAIIRLSGERAPLILAQCFHRVSGEGFPHARLCLGHVMDDRGLKIDEAMAVVMVAPNSYTREDVAEIHCHGGVTQARRVLSRVMYLGARAAMPGEFTSRAFLNGRIDLSEAEAVMSLVSSGSDASARSAMRQLEGGISRSISQWTQRLTDLVALIEAGDDFPDEIDEQATTEQVESGIYEILTALESVSDERNARILREGLHVALVGRPNTGKSSLLNYLLKSDRAIVTEHAGTTRDLLMESLLIEGYQVTLIDTAGQRDACDTIEQIGVERARVAQQQADLVFLLLDGSQALTIEDRALLKSVDARTRVLINKCDLDDKIDALELQNLNPIYVSAKTGAGMDTVMREMAMRASASGQIEGQLTLKRHIDCARRAISSLKHAQASIVSGAPIDLSAMDLMAALTSLYEITGHCASEEVIERVFASFCVGK